MKRLLGGFFFSVASVYLVITKSPDLITVTAVLACALLAGLSVTRHSEWAVIGGGMLVAGSLFIQSALSYMCTDCFRADLIILAGIICITVVHRGRLKKALRLLTSIMTIMMLAAAAIYTGPFIPAGAERLVALDRVGRHVTASSGERAMTLDTAAKPVVFFTPTCGACESAVEELVMVDPEGRRWVPVQTMGDEQEGREFLRQKGYTGEMYTSDWPGAVPAMVLTRDGITQKIIGQEKMIRIVRGEAG